MCHLIKGYIYIYTHAKRRYLLSNCYRIGDSTQPIPFFSSGSVSLVTLGLGGRYTAITLRLKYCILHQVIKGYEYYGILTIVYYALAAAFHHSRMPDGLGNYTGSSAMAPLDIVNKTCRLRRPHSKHSARGRPSQQSG